MDEAFEAECEKEGWAIFDAGGQIEVQLDDELVGTIENGPESDADALELAKLFLARKCKQLFAGDRKITTSERRAMFNLADAILNTEEGM